MPFNSYMENHISRLGFLFLAYAIISGGYVSHVLPCET